MNELIVDSFAGGGGASSGIEQALSRSPDIAINHNPAAIAMHAANHPKTRHFTEDVFKVSPRSVTKGRPVGLLWASPDCRHFSRAKGSKPVAKRIRGLAWVVIKWAVEAAPRVIILENVREFQEWGPVVPRWKCLSCDWKGTEGQATLLRKRPRCPRCEAKIVIEELPRVPVPSWKEWRAKTKGHGGTRAEYQKLVASSGGGPVLVPCPERKGLTFKKFTGRLRNLGYTVDYKVLNAADYGAPTHRRRLFLVARNDGLPIEWPAPTHGDPKKIGERDLFSGPLKPWRTAAECIDWSIPCPSIFSRKKPLADKTLRRIALGVKRYVLDNPKPFLVVCNHGGDEFRGQGVDAPLPTVTAARDAHGVVIPHLTKFRTGSVGSGIDEPMPTVTANSFVKRPGGCAPIGVVEATITPFVAGVGGRAGETPPTRADAPVGTITAKNDRVLVAPVLTPFIAPQYTQSGACPADAPLPTVMAGGMGKQVLITPTLIQTGYGEREGQSPRCLDIETPLGTLVGTSKHALIVPVLAHLANGDFADGSGGKRCGSIESPLGTVHSGGKNFALVSAFFAKHYGGVVGQKADQPIGTVTAVDHHSLVAANLVHLNHGEKTWNAADEPLRTVTSSPHAALVYSFMVKYFGVGVGQAVDEPLHTITGKDRFGLITVEVNGEPYVIADIGMRMLRPRELANAQGFPKSYILAGTATNQVERIGNSVCPDVAAAVVAANYVERTVPVAKVKRKAKVRAC